MIFYEIINGEGGEHEYQWRDVYMPAFDTRNLKNRVAKPIIVAGGVYALIKIGQALVAADVAASCKN